MARKQSRSADDALKEYEVWKTVVHNDDANLYSLKVPGGWLYLYERFGPEEEAGVATCAMTFVPEWFDPVKTEAVEHLKEIVALLRWHR